ncbi:MAG: hypothetical protein VYC98_12535, partial [Planctomycetota bacterium]|nr:hypothetical protein [Planctomycetota bacterium]
LLSRLVNALDPNKTVFISKGGLQPDRSKAGICRQANSMASRVPATGTPRFGTEFCIPPTAFELRQSVMSKYHSNAISQDNYC